METLPIDRVAKFLAARRLSRRAALRAAALTAGTAALGTVAAAAQGTPSAANPATTPLPLCPGCPMGTPGPGEVDNGAPAPPAIGADIPLVYFGPAPSEVQKELIGPYQLVKSGTIDTTAGTITLPLYHGHLTDGRDVWYILLDTTDAGNAAALGLNLSNKLTYAGVGKGARTATLGKDATLTFTSGSVDFKPVRQVTPGAAPNAFPPKVANPGSVGDADYSPLVRVTNAGDAIYNAPMVAFGVSADQLNAFCNGSPDYSMVHDKVLKICPQTQSVTLLLTPGFSFGRPVLYLSMDSSDPAVAAIEDVTYAPGLRDIKTGLDDSFGSATERLFVAINGPMGKGNPQRQGLDSALSGEGRGPLNVLGGIPTVATDYSPLWDLNAYQWTAEAVAKGYRARVTDEFAVLGLAEQGWITGPGGVRFGSIGVIVNCPVVWRFL